MKAPGSRRLPGTGSRTAHGSGILFPSAAGGERLLRGKRALSAPARRTAAALGSCQPSPGRGWPPPASRPQAGRQARAPGVQPLLCKPHDRSSRRAARRWQPAVPARAKPRAQRGSAALGSALRSAAKAEIKTQLRKRPRGLPSAGLSFSSPQSPGKGGLLSSGSRRPRKAGPGEASFARAPPSRRPRSRGRSQPGREAGLPSPPVGNRRAPRSRCCGGGPVPNTSPTSLPTGPPPPGAGNVLAALSREQRGRYGLRGARGPRASFPSSSPFLSLPFPLPFPGPSTVPPREHTHPGASCS